MDSRIASAAAGGLLGLGSGEGQVLLNDGAEIWRFPASFRSPLRVSGEQGYHIDMDFGGPDVHAGDKITKLSHRDRVHPQVIDLGCKHGAGKTDRTAAALPGPQAITSKDYAIFHIICSLANLPVGLGAGEN